MAHSGGFSGQWCRRSLDAAVSSSAMPEIAKEIAKATKRMGFPDMEQTFGKANENISKKVISDKFPLLRSTINELDIAATPSKEVSIVKNFLILF
jgi:hypothetical protein